MNVKHTLQAKKYVKYKYTSILFGLRLSLWLYFGCVWFKCLFSNVLSDWAAILHAIWKTLSWTAYSFMI